MFCVYLTIYKGNKLPPFYIGYSKVDNVKNGYNGSVSSDYKQVWMNERALNPHLFETKILVTFKTQEEANSREIELLRKLNAVHNPLYLNLCAFPHFNRKGIKLDYDVWNKGKSGCFSPETIDKMRAAKLGRTQTLEHRIKISKGNTGRTFSEETRTKISKSRRGKFKKFGSDNHFFGKKHTQESKVKMRVPKSNSHKEKLSQAKIGRKWCNNGIVERLCFDITDGWVPGRLYGTKK